MPATLVDIRPVDAERRNFVVLTLRPGGLREPRIPFERGGNSPAVGERDHQLGGCERNGGGTQIADLNFQNAHSSGPEPSVSTGGLLGQSTGDSFVTASKKLLPSEVQYE